MAMGRPERPYKPSWGGDPIPGLYRCPDGRWRIKATGKKFTEHDEMRAIQRFRAWKASTTPVVKLPTNVRGELIDVRAITTVDDQPVSHTSACVVADAIDAAQELDFTPAVKVDAYYPVPDDSFWPWLAMMLRDRPEYLAEKTGDVRLRGLRHMNAPRPSLKLQELFNVYRQQNSSTAETKRAAARIWDRFTEQTKARTLDDLTQEALANFRLSIENDANLTSAGSKKQIYGKIRSIIAFGKKVGLDTVQIDAALSRAEILWTADPMPECDPKPISREAFHKLLNAGNGSWRPWLLCGLNLCMSIEEVCDLRWEHFDLDHKTYAAIRKKTRRQRIPRAACLWDETIAALEKLPRRGPFVFTSRHGDRYSKRSRVNKFKELRESAGLPDDVTFSTLRDGAYTSACQGSADEKWARVLAGHKATGLQDRYVLRNPEGTRSACEAVYKMYGPFPEKTTPVA